MTSRGVITFVSHTNKPGGGELALRRYLEATALPVRLVTMEAGGVWDGMAVDVIVVEGVRGLWSTLRGGGLVIANSMRAAFLIALVLPRHGRLVYWVRDGMMHSAMSKTALLLTRHVTSRRVWAYLANSEWTAATVHRALGAAASDVHVVQSMCGVGARSMSTAPRPTPTPPYRLLYLGRLAAWKAPHIAVQALEDLRERGLDVTLSVAGDAQFGEEAYSARLTERVAATDGVTLLGHVDDVPALLHRHDLTVHCSLRPEPFGQVIVQSLAAGVPVVATEGGGPTEILSGSPVNLAYTPGEARELASAVERALAAYDAVSAWALTTSQKYSDDSASAQTDAAIDSIQQKILREITPGPAS